MNKHGILLLLFLSTFSFLYGQSRITIEITSSTEIKTNALILIGEKKTNFLDEFCTQLVKDLNYSDYLEIKNTSFKENYNIQSEMDDGLSKYNANILIFCKMNGKLKTVIYDTVEKTIFSQFTIDIGKSPVELAHIVSDEIVYRLTGKPGIARSKILYMTRNDGKYCLMVADYDGSNATILLSTDYIINYPRWFPDMKKVLFLSYRKLFPSLDIFNLETNQIETFLAEPGLNACASFFRNQNRAAVVLSRSGNPDIYLVDLNGNILKRLTEKKGLNASPSVSPGGENIAFVSDRDGKTRLWVMNVHGLNVRKLDIPSNYITSPCWSPDGKYLAYAVRYGTEM
ncbi:MAG: hypothetical protein ACP5QD_02570, partial [Candidatus Ratteibacteria bacterium]